ncbi:MAG: twin-arginine translocation signal domain-containing protein [Dehalococcoidia bacterium]|nr:twin-arginine translocation signal domain-containing protein [Dehalococcoidia bacterium]
MKNGKKKNAISRREFLKQASAVVGGGALISLVASSCEPATTSNAKPPSNNTGVNTTKEPGNNYVEYPPYIDVPLMEVPGSACDYFVATDRKYSPYHTWVFPLEDSIAQIGISDYFHKDCQLHICEIYAKVGLTLDAYLEDTFANIITDKISTDIVTPISGTVTEINPYVKDFLLDETFGRGWMIKVRLSNPDELSKLYTPEYYAYLISPNWSGTVPPMYSE